MLNIVQNIDWFNISELLKNSFGNDIYNAWLSKLNFVSCDDNIITLSVGMPYLKEYIENNFLNGIRVIKKFVLKAYALIPLSLNP